MRDHLPEFEACVRRAPTSKKAERVVRILLGRWAKHCPMHVLVQLGQCIVDCRRSELRGEAERN